MLKDEKILVTGVTGGIAAPIAAYLAQNNEVWGAARFREDGVAAKAGEIRVSQRESQAEIEAMGIRPVHVDLATGDLSHLPDDFTYVLHCAFARVPRQPDQFELAYRINGDGTGFVLQHCRKAKAALLMSSGTIYSPMEDPWHHYTEEDSVGGAQAYWSPSSPVSKLLQEGVASFCSRAFNLPIVITRLFSPYGGPKLGPSLDIQGIRGGHEMILQNGPEPMSPIHIDDICAQVEPLLGAAGTPPLVVNWGGDTTVTREQWLQQATERLGLDTKIKRTESNRTHSGFIGDPTRRKSITGPCAVTDFARAFDETIDAYHI